MPFEIVRNDIVNMQADAVVNAANPNPVIGPSVDSGIHKKSGYELLVARQKIGALILVTQLLPQDSSWMPSMLSVL